MAIEIRIINRQSKARPDRKRLGWVIEKTVRKNFPGFSPVEIGLALTDNALIRKINRQYRATDRVTDVIAFPSAALDGPGGHGKIYGGDIFISVERARSQAKEYGSSCEDELTLLLVHGIMHVFGYDHKKKSEAAVMEKKEKETLEWLKGLKSQKEK